MTLELNELHPQTMFKEGDATAYASYYPQTGQIVVFPKPHCGWFMKPEETISDSIQHEWLHKILTEKMDVPVGTEQHKIIYSMIGYKSKGDFWGTTVMPPQIDKYLRGYSMKELFGSLNVE